MIEIKRVEKAAHKAAFLRRVFTEGEISLYEGRGRNPSVLAGCFAGKEAAAKALGTGFSGFWPSDIEVLRRESGEPYVNLYNKALDKFNELGALKIHISLTNTNENAAAVVVFEK